MQPDTKGQAAPAMDAPKNDLLLDRMLRLQAENESLRWRNAMLSEQLAKRDEGTSALDLAVYFALGFAAGGLIFILWIGQ